MWECSDNCVDVLAICALIRVFTVFFYCFVYVYLFLFAMYVLVYGLLSPSDDSIAVSK